MILGCLLAVGFAGPAAGKAAETPEATETAKEAEPTDSAVTAEPENPVVAPGPEETAEPAAVVKGWDADKTHYYKNGKALTGLQKIKGSFYYFNSKGVVLKNKWKKLPSDGKKYWFYFGKDGAAYKAKASTFEVTFKTYKIDGKTYGFDASSHRVTGLWATGKGKAFYFNSKGVYNAAKTKSIRALTKSGKKSKTLLAQVKKACGKPKKTETAQSCNFFDAADHEYKDYRLFYSHVTVEMTKDVTTGMFKMNGIFALLLD